MQRAGTFGQQAEYFPVAALHLGRPGLGGGDLGVDVSEELGELPGTGPGWHDALLVVAEFGPDQVQVPLAFVLVDLGEKLGDSQRSQVSKERRDYADACKSVGIKP